MSYVGRIRNPSGLTMESQRGPNYSVIKEKKMPLAEGKEARTKEGFSKNIETEMHEGKPQKQAVAIAYSEARRNKPKMSHSHRGHKEHR